MQVQKTSSIQMDDETTDPGGHPRVDLDGSGSVASPSA